MRKLSLFGFIVASVLLSGCGGGGAAPVAGLTLPAISAGTGAGLNISPANGANWTSFTTANGLGSDVVSKVIHSGTAIYAQTGDSVSVSPNGTTFTKVTGIGSVSGLDFSAGTLYASSDLGVNTSVDGGVTWTQNPNNMDLTYGISVSGSTIATTAGGKSIRFSLDGGATWSLQRLTFSAFNTSAIFAEGAAIYAGTDGSGLMISTDSGATFTNYPTGTGTQNDIRTITSSGSSIYVGTTGGLGVSSDGGATWTFRTTTDGLPNNGVNAIAVKDSKIYVGTSGGLSVSTDAGATWTTFTTANGLSNNSVSAIALP